MSLYVKGKVNLISWVLRANSLTLRGMDNKRKDSKHWKWGLIYYNPDDPSLYIEKRFGLGQTFNFAHRTAWYLLLFLLLFPVLIVVLLLVFT